MNILPSDLLLAMRMAAWERAKGEMNAFLHCFFGDDRFDFYSCTIEDFIKEMEDHF